MKVKFKRPVNHQPAAIAPCAFFFSFISSISFTLLLLLLHLHLQTKSILVIGVNALCRQYKEYSIPDFLISFSFIILQLTIFSHRSQSLTVPVTL